MFSKCFILKNCCVWKYERKSDKMKDILSKCEELDDSTKTKYKNKIWQKNLIFIKIWNS